MECPDSGGPRSPHHDQDADEDYGLLFVGGCWASFMGFPGFLGLIGLLGFPGLTNEGDPEFFINRYRDYHHRHVNQAQLGCAPGIVRTKVGYGGGSTPSPSYRWK